MSRNSSPNHAPRGPEQQTSHDRLLDNQTILATDAKANGLKTASLSEQATYDDQLHGALFYGELHACEQDGSIAPTNEIVDASSLRSAFLELGQEIVDNNNSIKPHKNNTVFDNNRLPRASLASSVAANIPHPEAFMQKMHAKFKAENPRADDKQKAEFTKGLDSLAAMLYGSRFLEYNQQRKDTAAPGPELNKGERDKHNRQVDVEILGRSYRLRRTVRGVAEQTLTKAAYARAFVGTAKAMPGLIGSNLTHKVASVPHSLLQNSANTATNKYVKFGLQKAADAYQQRVTSHTERWHRTRVEANNQRWENYDNAKEHNRLIYQGHIDRYKSAKQSGIALREVRREMKSIDQSDPDKQRNVWTKSKALLERRIAYHGFKNSATTEQLNQLGRAARIREIAQEKMDAVAKQHVENQQKISDTEQRIQNMSDTITTNIDAIDRFQTTLDRLNTVSIPKAEKLLQEAQNNLDSVDPTDRVHIQLEHMRDTHAAQLEQLRAGIKKVTSEIARLEKENEKLDKQRVAAEEKKNAEVLRRDATHTKLALAVTAFRGTSGSFGRSFDRIVTKDNQGRNP